MTTTETSGPTISTDAAVDAATNLVDTPLGGADPAAVVEGPGYRFTILTSRLIRMEHSATGAFVDEPTQLVQRRRFPVPEFSVTDHGESLDIWTEDLHLHYEKGPFSSAGLTVTMRRRAQFSHRTTWRYGDAPYIDDGRLSNLGGTARTLDDVDGATELEPGLLSVHGYAVVDDSASLVLDADGARPRPGTAEDLYFFGYGRDYQGALQDFFALSGSSPLLPRWTLGNWWSRFYRYTAEDYLALMDRFRDAGVPFSVAVIDMDWHLVDIDPALGSGWTGYTWNTELFPDPPAFLAALHDRNLRVTLNVHPADGVRSHEAAYADVARAVGIDPSSGHGVAFDVTSPAFVEAYLRFLHHPLEAEGVDFWWIDWQSGSHSRVPGLDPLWALNHLHYVDSGRDGERPLTFSRYAGLGSHRYPVGFSGDTVTTWDSLRFQPYFTATAANVGYFWWSHDIGGHLGGVKDDELATRWYQFGVFSPINRLHTSSSQFASKEPWAFGPVAEKVMTQFLELRHRLVPYLYSATWDSHTDGVGVVRPMYHDHPNDERAYSVANQYMFGPDLLVAPITDPTDRQTHHARVDAWLPAGDWYDVFTGRRYRGDRSLAMYRTLESMPVLARAGAILPLATDPMADVAASPEALTLRIFPGANGRTVLLEDAGQGAPTVADRHETELTLRWDTDPAGNQQAVIAVAPPTGPGVLVERTVTIELMGVREVAGARLTASGADLPIAVEPAPAGGPLVVELGTVDLSGGLELHLDGVDVAPPGVGAQVFEVLREAEIAYDLKTRVMAEVEKQSGSALLSTLHALDLPGNLLGVLTEIISADAH